MMLWHAFLSMVFATEGLGAIQGRTVPAPVMDRPWRLDVQHQFWVQPTVYSTDIWNTAPVSDVLIQSMFVQYRASEHWNARLYIPFVFVGSQEVYRRGNQRLGVGYHQKLGRWESQVALDVFAKGKEGTLITWSNRGLYPNIHLNRVGGRWLMNIHTGAVWTGSFYPNGTLLVRQNRERKFPLEMGLEGLMLQDGLWYGGLWKVSRELEAVSFSLVHRIPLSGQPVQGSAIELTVAYTPSTIRRDTDRDGDGVSNLEDFCTDEPEDMDGFEDDDGCPDIDNDLDGVEDTLDQCPVFAEDVDGFEDDDGCPDPDNDKDNILDVVDRCPSQPETLNQYQDNDGCPDGDRNPDFDGDGLWDNVDGCPMDAEDMDGVEDDDGCPDPDALNDWMDKLRESDDVQ